MPSTVRPRGAAAPRPHPRSRVAPARARAAAAAPSPDADRRKGALHGSTVSVLRDMIVTGALAPGERLNERELCERLQVSRTPVREAIKTLVQEALLQSLPNRSPVVAPLDVDDIEALVDVVATIEALAGELAAERISEAQVAELGILHYTMKRSHALDRMPDYFEANRAFHRRIVECAGNAVLLWVWDQLALRVDRARYASNRSPARWRKAMEEHAGILAALAARDAPAASAAMREHVRNGLSVLLDALRRDAAGPVAAPSKVRPLRPRGSAA
jgi:DNA-binding GntR family transcriptional regulator